MPKKKMTMAEWEKSPMDKAKDKNLGYKEVRPTMRRIKRRWRKLIRIEIKQGYRRAAVAFYIAHSELTC